LARPPRLELLGHRPEQLVGQHLVPAGALQADALGGLHIAPDRLAVGLHQLGDPSVAMALQPQPEDLAHLNHGNLPEQRQHLLVAS